MSEFSSGSCAVQAAQNLKSNANANTANAASVSLDDLPAPLKQSVSVWDAGGTGGAGGVESACEVTGQWALTDWLTLVARQERVKMEAPHFHLVYAQNEFLTQTGNRTLLLASSAGQATLKVLHFG